MDSAGHDGARRRAAAQEADYAPRDFGDRDVVVASPALDAGDGALPNAIGCGCRASLFNFIMMAMCFSINHGVATALIALASSQFEEGLGGYSTGVLYACYTLSALLISTGVVKKIGAKYALCTGLFAYCAYVSAFLVASVVETTEARWAAVLTGSAISGVGAGLLWTAQGQYMVASKQLYAKEAGIDEKEASGLFAGIFTAIYMSFEVLMKLLSSTLELEAHAETVYTIFIILAVGSATLMLFVRDLKPKAKVNDSNGAEVEDAWSWFGKMLSAVELLKNNRKMWLLVPFNFTFGFAAALLQYYANKELVTARLQPADSTQSYVGFAGCIAVGSGTIASIVFGTLTKRIGKRVPMIIGMACFFILAVSFAVFPLNSLGTWQAVAPLYMCHGIGRGVWESVNKAVVADFFPDDATAAFANVTMLSGFASTLAFFIFPNVSKDVMAGSVLISSVLGVTGFLVAARIDAAECTERDNSGEKNETDTLLAAGRDSEDSDSLIHD